MTDERINRLENEVQSLKSEISEMRTTQAVAAATSASIDRRLGDIESSIQWIGRLLIGGLAAGALGFVINGGLNIG